MEEREEHWTRAGEPEDRKAGDELEAWLTRGPEALRL
jgi:hypothetical protein